MHVQTNRNLTVGLKRKAVITSVFRGFLHLGAGLSVGLCGTAAGWTIGVVGDSGVRGTALQPRLFVGMVLVLIFAEVLGLYGLIIALILSSQGSTNWLWRCCFIDWSNVVPILRNSALNVLGINRLSTSQPHHWFACTRATLKLLTLLGVLAK